MRRKFCLATWPGGHRTITLRSLFAKSPTTSCKQLQLPRNEKRGVQRGCKRLRRSRAEIIHPTCCPCTVQRRTQGRVQLRTTSIPRGHQIALREWLVHKATTRFKPISIRRRRLAYGKEGSSPYQSSTIKRSTKVDRRAPAVAIIIEVCQTSFV